MKQRILIVVGVGAAALVLASAALAGQLTATATVSAGNGGNLSLSLPSNPSIAATLDGSDQTVSYSLGLGLSDVRGSGAGWNLTVTSTSFSDGSGHALANSASSISGVTSGCVTGGSCTGPSNSIGYPLTVPAAASAPAAVKLFNAAQNSGMGRFTVTPSIDVAIPGNAYAGSYSSTLTIAAVSGP
jgi:WxL domain surface cell wall-binding